MTVAPSRTFAGLALLAALLAGCGTVVVGGTPSAEGQNPPAAAEAGSAPAGASGGGGGTPVDACSIFTDAEVEKLIGSSPPGKSTSAGGDSDGGGCTWEDTDNYFSLTVDIGETDTAINGTLPPWDPALGEERTLPGGMRDINGAIQFVCGGTRYCSVQVATNKGKADQQTGISLVPKIRAKVGG
jgi:hypothetical protein